MVHLCKLCMNQFDYHGILSPPKICTNCFKQFEVIAKKEIFFEIEVLFLYTYNDIFKNTLYLFKGCFDYELSSVFLNRFIHELRMKYHNYLIVPIPSNKSEDDKRGYNHVEEMFSFLKLEMTKIIYKNKVFKQSKRNKDERKKVINDFSLIENVDIKGKNILIVDDVFTTGSSLHSAINLIKKKDPKNIKALILAKVT